MPPKGSNGKSAPPARFTIAVLLAAAGALSAAPPARSIFTLIVCPAGPERPRNSEGDIVKLRNGQLLLAYSEFIGSDGSDFGSARIGAKTSRDGGHTWSAPYVLMPNDGRMNVMSPSLLRLKSGRLAFSYTVKNSTSDDRVYVRISSDEARTWSAPVRVNAQTGYWGINNARLVQLRSGRILAPLWFVDDWNKSHHTKDLASYSDDEGKTWSLGGVVDIP
ncbi:MAG: sialidase family protein, partial [Bryobacteraceae bacterium]